MIGLRTIAVGLLMAVIPVVTQYFGAVDWNSVLPAPWSFVAASVVMVIMRLVTSTPVFTSK